MIPGRAAALLLCTVALPGCVPVLAGISASKAIYDTVHEVTTATSGAIKVACADWDIRKATAAQRVTDGVVPIAKAQQAADLAPWLNATCDPHAPAPADPLAAAVWVAGLAGRVEMLTEATKP